MPDALRIAAHPRGPLDGGKIVNSRSKLLINNNIVELDAVPHLLACRVDPALDRTLVVLTKTHQSLLVRSE